MAPVYSPTTVVQALLQALQATGFPSGSAQTCHGQVHGSYRVFLRLAGPARRLERDAIGS